MQDLVVQRRHQAGVVADRGITLNKGEVGAAAGPVDPFHVFDAAAGRPDLGRLNDARALEHPRESLPESVVGAGFRTGSDDDLVLGLVSRQHAITVETTDDQGQGNDRGEDRRDRD